MRPKHLVIALLVVGFSLAVCLPSASQCARRWSDEICCCNCPDSRCRTADCLCAGPVQAGSYLDVLHPGLFAEQVRGQLVVAALIPGSPAEEAGVLPGDQIVRVNGHLVFEPGCHGRGWRNGDSDSVAHLVLSREGRERTVIVTLLPIRDYLQKAWIRKSAGFVPAGLKDGGVPVFESYGPYLFGLRVMREGQYLIVTDVLRGSPASEAGLRSGDVISAIDAAPPSQFNVNKLAPAARRSQVELLVDRGGSQWRVRLVAKGISDIFQTFVKVSPAAPTQVIALADAASQ